ncbi:hypothetical protein QBC39DRAFT_314013 [Podospora conica]|nr:hypothetical protein QBC39DRAFT_314013 [Schizothecium conicum]
MKGTTTTSVVDLSVLLLLLLQASVPVCNAQSDTDAMWLLCPTVQHPNCDAFERINKEACGPEIPRGSLCNCRQDFINHYVNCQAELTACSGDLAMKPSDWQDAFSVWQNKCSAVMASSSITMPTPTTTLSPAERSNAPMASCDAVGTRAVFCSQAQSSQASCLSTTYDAVNTLGALPCLCDANILDMLELCDAAGGAAKCGVPMTDAPWADRLRETCYQMGLNPDVTATRDSGGSLATGTSTLQITFAPLGPTSTSESKGGRTLLVPAYSVLLFWLPVVLVGLY